MQLTETFYVFHRICSLIQETTTKKNYCVKLEYQNQRTSVGTGVRNEGGVTGNTPVCPWVR